MDKNFLEDVVPPKGRSIRNIPINRNRRARNSSSSIASSRSKKENRIEHNTPPPKKPRKQKIPYDLDDSSSTKKRKSIIIVGGLVGIVILLFILTFFSGAEITIYPKKAEADTNISLSSFNIDLVSHGTGLSYRENQLTKEVSESLKATGEETVEEKASGKITIYNNHTENKQPLVKNTRFESPDGLIFRINQSVEVPGKSEEGPGKIEVTVYADSVGDEYNIKATKFTIPGFKGLPQFDNFYAESQEKMSGGFVGTRKIVKEEDIDDALNTLRDNLMISLKDDVKNNTADNTYVIYNQSSFLFEEMPKQDSGKDNVLVTLRGTLKTYEFDLNELSMAIAKEISLQGYSEGNYILIENIDELNIETEMIDNKLILKISGNARFLWTTDHDRLKKELSGSTRKDLKTVLQSYPSITRAEAVIKPFWKKAFPETIEKIKIVEENEK